ncbi:hypothetical protein PIB30_010214 [Stylosanthes scabra]|uniref:Receptor-interacting protein n=1 Tax=Stylosanthes scabra TaxID=79078 RepID=A0ABU6S5S6_9FABA|nr:hypothetical protein [Stylosanthes scabra]
MISLHPYKACVQIQSTCLFNPSKLITRSYKATPPRKVSPNTRQVIKCSSGGHQGDNKPDKRTFLSLEEAGLVEISGLSTHERFLCRLTISSLNLLRVISEQEGCPIEELNAGKVCDWFLKDKMKREQNIESAVLQWDDSEFIL